MGLRDFKFVQIYFSWGVDYGVAVECLVLLGTILVGVLKHLNGMINRDKVKHMLKLIESDSERLKDCPEYDVLYRHAMEGRRYAVMFIGMLVQLLITYLIMGTVLIVNDVLTKNETEEKYLMYPFEYYFFDAEEHYYVSTVHNYIISLIVVIVVVSLDTMYIIFIQHACALFAIAGYRVKTAHILDVNVLKNNEDLEKFKDVRFSRRDHEQVYKRVIICVQEHKRALEYTKIIQSTYSTTLFFQLALSVASISISGVLILLKSENATDVLRLGAWIVGQLFHLFFVCLPGQRLTNFSEKFYYDVLDCVWYSMQIKSRVLYRFLILNTLTPITITALKVTPLNLETFLSVTQACMSYFTVLSSRL